MSLKTRIRGFTAWINLRLKPYNQVLNDVLVDLLKGTSMRYLIKSLTGNDLEKFGSLDGLSQQQKITRVQWMIKELKSKGILKEDNDVYIDSRGFAMHSTDYMFDILWKLVSYDIFFIWECSAFLHQDSQEILCSFPFKWDSENPQKLKERVNRFRQCLSSMKLVLQMTKDHSEIKISHSSSVTSKLSDDSMELKLEDRKKSSSVKNNLPSSTECIMSLVIKQLSTIEEGRKLHCQSIDDLVDSRVLCALVNSFIPYAFPTEFLLNDRWTINEILRTIEIMFYASPSPFDSEDLVEANEISVSAYFCTFFMLAFKYKQCRAVANRAEHLNRALRMMTREMEDQNQMERLTEIKNDMSQIDSKLKDLETKFDVQFCTKWLNHVQICISDFHQKMSVKIKEKFDFVQIPRDVKIRDFCLSLAINLSLTEGNGFYSAEQKEKINERRKIIIFDKKSMTLQSRNQKEVRILLHLNDHDKTDIVPYDFPDYLIFVEALSTSKQLKSGRIFLYQVFANKLFTWNKLLLRAIQDNDVEAVDRMTQFMKNKNSFINAVVDRKSGNTPLHVACKLGHSKIVLCLLERGAHIDRRNSFNETPLFCACDGFHKNVGHLLIEWGCDVHVKGTRGGTAFQSLRNEEMREELQTIYERYSTFVPIVIKGDTTKLEQLVMNETNTFASLRSRCINGSTLLHTAAYFKCIKLVEKLLTMPGVDVFLLDYKGATALHRAKGVDMIQLLLDNGAVINARDAHGNTPLHVKCYDEKQQSQLDVIQKLLSSGSQINATNDQRLTPLHCAAMQGRVDVMDFLLKETRSEMFECLKGNASVPSLVYLALANDFIDSARWLIEKGFSLGYDENDKLLKRIIMHELKLQQPSISAQFLLDHGANSNSIYENGNTALHCAAMTPTQADLLLSLIKHGANVNTSNSYGSTALFTAFQSSNMIGAKLLIEHGADVNMKNAVGLTAFDYIADYKDWIENGNLDHEIVARLKAFQLRHMRNLIRSISEKVKISTESQSNISSVKHFTNSRLMSRSHYK